MIPRTASVPSVNLTVTSQPSSLRSDDGDTRRGLKTSFHRLTATTAASMRYYLTFSEMNSVWMTPSNMTPTYRRTGGEPLAFSSVSAKQESSSTQRNYISRGELLTSQGFAYLKPSSPCQNTWTPSANFRRQQLPRTFAAGLAL